MTDLDKLVPMPQPWTYFTTDQMLTLREATAKAVARRCVEICNAQQDMPECPERAEHCAQAIAAEFGLEVRG